MLFNTSEPASPGDKRESWKDWLDRNQRETWQMELLVTGFAIVLLGAVLEPMREWLTLFRLNAVGSFYGFILSWFVELLLLLGWAVTTFSLIIGVLIRSLWIASIGVRSFSGDINLSQLKFQPRFHIFLDRRLPPFDIYIERLERLCSSVFALTFLNVFVILGVGLFFIFLTLLVIALAAMHETLPEAVAEVSMPIVLWLVLGSLAISSVLYALDFLSSGAIKRSVGIQNIYYPVYRFFGWITGARLYRPLYYNLIDNPFGQRAILLIVPYVLALIAIISFEGALFTPLQPRDGNFAAASVADYGGTYVGREAETPHLGARVVTAGYLEIFLPLSDDYYPAIASCDSITKPYLRRSYTTTDYIKSNRLLSNFIGCVSEYVHVQLDDTYIQGIEYALVTEAVDQPHKLYSVVDVSALAKGRHYAKFYRTRSKSRDTVLVRQIPFFIP